ARGAGPLTADWPEWGALPPGVPCVVATGAALPTVIAQPPADQPLTGVVHTAGVLDDGVLTTLTPDRLDTVFGPKVDGARHLHELTRHEPLTIFVLFSSAAGILGSPAEGDYAAANAYLDALAHPRHPAARPPSSRIWR